MRALSKTIENTKRNAQYLWNFLEMHVETWDKTILMANIDIKDSGFTEKETKNIIKI